MLRGVFCSVSANNVQFYEVIKNKITYAPGCFLLFPSLPFFMLRCFSALLFQRKNAFIVTRPFLRRWLAEVVMQFFFSFQNCPNLLKNKRNKNVAQKMCQKKKFLGSDLDATSIYHTTVLNSKFQFLAASPEN